MDMQTLVIAGAAMTSRTLTVNISTSSGSREAPVVGVGSLVLKDVEPYTIVAGSPAKVLRTIPRPDEPEAKTTDPDAGPAGAVTAG